MTSNSTQNDTMDSGSLKSALVWTMALMSVMACVSNLLVIATILGTKSLRTISSVFLLNLSCCDFCIGFVMMPIMAHNVQLDKWTLSEDACIGFGMWNQLLQSGSIYTVTAISLDRYITIIHCLKYSSWSKYKYIFIVMLLIWVLSILITIPTVSRDYGHMMYDSSRYMCLSNWENRKDVVMVSVSLLYILPIIIMTFCYLKIIRVARSHARKISDMTKQINKNMTIRETNRSGIFGEDMLAPVHRISMISYPQRKITRHIDNDCVQLPRRISEKSLSRFEREARAAIRLVGLVLSFICCWTPFIVINCFRGYGYLKDVLPKWSFPVSSWLVVFHSALNPFLYAIMSKRFRFAVKRMFLKWFHFVIGTEEGINPISEIRSKVFETDNGIRTVSVLPLRKHQVMKSIPENRIRCDNKMSLETIDSEEMKTKCKSVCFIEKSNKPKKTEVKQDEENKQLNQPSVYLSVPKKSFANGNGSITIETITEDKFHGRKRSTSFIQVQEWNDNAPKPADDKSENGTKIRICVDLTT